MTKSGIEPGPYECVTFSNLDTTGEEDSQRLNGRPTNRDSSEHERQTGQLDWSTGTIDASYTREADQHASQPKAVRHIQGQQRSLVTIARRNCPMSAKAEFDGRPDSPDRSSSASAQ